MIGFPSAIESISTSFTEKEQVAVLQKIWTSFTELATPRDYLCLYINVPFCPQHCSFCEYPSKICRNGINDTYIDILEKRFQRASQAFAGFPVSVIMFGGGSPSLLSSSQLQRILDMIIHYWNVDLSVNYERGFELHPGQISNEQLEVLRSSYINRYSMGIQSFDQRVLSAENRTFVPLYRIAEIYSALSNAISINTDLLAGLRHQHAEILSHDVQQLMLLGIPSITVYELNAIAGHRADKEKIVAMLKHLYRTFPSMRNAEQYVYGGTTDSEFQHCNRIVKRGTSEFERSYSPVPTGFNSIVSFSLDDSSSFSQHAWSMFLPLDVAYEVKGKKLNVYSMKRAADTDRPFWQEGLRRRKELI